MNAERESSTVSLANQTRSIMVLNLPYEVVPECSSRGVAGTRDHDPTSGARSVRAHKKKISGSITLMPKGMEGDMSAGLPLSVLKAPDVERALKAWPPKLASKIQTRTELEASRTKAAEATEVAKKAAEETARLRQVRADRLAVMAGADVKPASEPKPNAPSTKPGRVARSDKE